MNPQSGAPRRQPTGVAWQRLAWLLALMSWHGCGTTAQQVRPQPAQTASAPAPPPPAEQPKAATSPVSATTPAPAAPAPVPPADKPPVLATSPTTVGDVREFPPGTPDETLRKAFRCALDADFDCYVALQVRSNVDTPILLGQLRNYQWKVFVQRAAGYVIGKDPFTLRIVRRDPDMEPHGRVRRHKIFLYSPMRDNPTPIILQLEDGAWRIYANSL